MSNHYHIEIQKWHSLTFINNNELQIQEIEKSILYPCLIQKPINFPVCPKPLDIKQMNTLNKKYKNCNQNENDIKKVDDYYFENQYNDDEDEDEDENDFYDDLKYKLIINKKKCKKMNYNNDENDSY